MRLMFEKLTVPRICDLRLRGHFRGMPLQKPKNLSELMHSSNMRILLKIWMFFEPASATTCGNFHENQLRKEWLLNKSRLKGLFGEENFGKLDVNYSSIKMVNNDGLLSLTSGNFTGT